MYIYTYARDVSARAMRGASNLARSFSTDDELVGGEEEEDDALVWI